MRRRMRLLVGVAVVAAMLVTAGADAAPAAAVGWHGLTRRAWLAQPPAPPGAAAMISGPHADRCLTAVSRIGYPWTRLAFPIVCKEADPLVGGRTWESFTDHHIEIYVRSDWTDVQLAKVIAHELGHAVEWYSVVIAPDWQVRRQGYLMARGIDAATEWWGACADCDLWRGPSEDFAAVFALTQVGPQDFASPLLPPPDAATLTRLVPFFDPAVIR